MKKYFTKSRIIGCFLLLALASTGILTTSYSRYIHQASASGVAAIAEWGSESIFTIDLKDLAPGDSAEYAFIVTNKKDGKVSQAAQEYRIRVETMGNLPLVLTLTPEAAGAGLGTVIPAGSGESLDLPGGVLPHTAEASHRYTLTVGWPDDRTESSYTDEIDLVTVTVKAEQLLPAS